MRGEPDHRARARRDPRSAETIYRSFNFPTAWEKVRYEDAAGWPARGDDLAVAEGLRGGSVAPLFPRIKEAPAG